jgi:hypothetical protein
MFEFPKLISKKTWFVTFYAMTIIYLIATRSLRWDAVSIISSGLALGLMNCIAWISARRYKDWK